MPKATKSGAGSLPGDLDPAYSDDDVRNFIERAPRRQTFTEVAEACLLQFGPRRAWSRQKIREYWETVHPIKRRGCHFEDRLDILQFVEERLGRMSLGDIAWLCRDEFGAAAPSRSAIHRYSQRKRKV